MSVHVRIDTLVLDGLARSDAAAVQAALENELARLFGASASPLPVSGPAAIGVAVAQAVYRSVRP